MKTFEGLSEAQDRALGLIAINQHPHCAQKTLDALLERGLIEADERTVGRDALGPIVVTDYFVPLPVHYAWCMWCAQTFPDGVWTADTQPDKPSESSSRAADHTNTLNPAASILASSSAEDSTP